MATCSPTHACCRSAARRLANSQKPPTKTGKRSSLGTLLEQALDPNERRRLGAHYTPRAYVERLVVATIIEPLREDWRNVQAAAENLRASGDPKASLAAVKAYHDTLCEM